METVTHQKNQLNPFMRLIAIRQRHTHSPVNIAMLSVKIHLPAGCLHVCGKSDAGRACSAVHNKHVARWCVQLRDSGRDSRGWRSALSANELQSFGNRRRGSRSTSEKASLIDKQRSRRATATRVVFARLVRRKLHPRGLPRTRNVALRDGHLVHVDVRRLRDARI